MTAMTTEQAMGVRVYAADGPLSQGMWVVMGPRLDGCEGQTVLFGPDTLLACNEAREILASVIA